MKKWLVGLLVSWLVGLLVVGCASYVDRSDRTFPNPYVVNSGATQVYFNDLAATCTIEISTSMGELVRTINEIDGDGQATWDIKDANGNDLTGGIYLYIIKSTENEMKGKIVITR